MDPSSYERFAAQLVDFAETDERVVGLVALGSMADETRRDEWSDHDFWLVARPGTGSGLLAEKAWLPDPHRIVIHFQETEHGRSAIYEDAHLVEYAVFEENELHVARANACAVLVDKADVGDRMAEMVALTQDEHASRDADGSDRFGSFAAQLVIGLTRHARGEELSANHLIRGWAVRSLVSSLALVVSTDAPAELDNLDPHRRFELAYPRLGRRLKEAIEGSIPGLATVMLDIADEHLLGAIPAATPESLHALRRLVERVTQADP